MYEKVFFCSVCSLNFLLKFLGRRHWLLDFPVVFHALLDIGVVDNARKGKHHAEKAHRISIAVHKEQSACKNDKELKVAQNIVNNRVGLPYYQVNAEIDAKGE